MILCTCCIGIGCFSSGPGWTSWYDLFPYSHRTCMQGFENISFMGWKFEIEYSKVQMPLSFQRPLDLHTHLFTKLLLDARNVSISPYDAAILALIAYATFKYILYIQRLIWYNYFIILFTLYQIVRLLLFLFLFPARNFSF